MADTITTTFVIPGSPVGKGRPRFTKQGKAYTPRATRQWESAAAKLCALQWPHPPHYGPISIQVLALYPRPKAPPTHVPSAIWHQGGRVYRPASPDLDNVIKACCDALQLACIFEDDRQVVHLQAWAAWCGVDDETSTTITITAPPEHGPPTKVGP
jgi:Holliday junction resolvase RusA-like endonuclease